ncbi:EAL domain-containing response regulator [Lamprobacter modestohalophilus]|uniref:EAL domain-containing response regulator n=1 Tax=Lamprobacter modestohalophilus TaxID=1064514 RepID=UPI002ADEE49B|nr:EAL domain-containing response regulator [Lamprobacter modestohalophilus]MCF7994933.1 EAL domain-containing protein [Chromatiaceae bacterium]MCF8014123.1 EAL domain-containing protein [Chromatiaceae bacterium]MEA1051914.1 EAL domain-containing response regulator [Lamprobacter modestohalophilus]
MILTCLDDDPRMERTLRRFAGSLGHKVRFQTTSRGLREDMEHQVPDVVVLDLSLGTETGVDVLGWLAEHHANVPVVFLSGHADELLDTARRIAQGNGLAVYGAINKANLVRELPEVLARCRPPERPKKTPAQPQEALDVETLREHLSAGRIKPYFQPILLASSLKPVGAEVLARLSLPDGGVLGAGAFIPLAERSGLIMELTRVLSERLIELEPRLRPLGLDFISVNLSAANVESTQAAAMVKHLVDAFAGSSRIMIELTETAVLPDLQQMRELTTQLRLGGASLAIDDFGIGYSSIRALAELPYDALKIDLSFVAEMFDSEKSANLIASMVHMAHSLHLKVVAEGVETEAQRDRLIEMGVDRLQGYLFGRPVPIEQFVL